MPTPSASARAARCPKPEVRQQAKAGSWFDELFLAGNGADRLSISYDNRTSS
jgi:hypothetical protein